jgi:flavin reductase (DIM6/NTAB) family NADH-FMN oxidoreductase RutF
MTCTDETKTKAGVTTGVTAAELRHAMGHFATGVTVITSIGADGQPVGTTANAVSSLSLDPPLLLVCFDRSSQTLAAIQSHRAFVVNVLAAPQEEVSANFARRGLAADWDSVPHRTGRTGCPRLHGVLAALDCTVEHRLPGGDHEIVVGRVCEVETGNGEAAPLLFWHGRYASLTDDQNHADVHALNQRAGLAVRASPTPRKESLIRAKAGWLFGVSSVACCCLRVARGRCDVWYVAFYASEALSGHDRGPCMPDIRSLWPTIMNHPSRPTPARDAI